jgi:NAD-dependent SIR2 family protein deacetylase
MNDGAAFYTGNADGIFRKRDSLMNGLPSAHGSIHWLQCAYTCRDDVWSADDLSVELDETKCCLMSLLPRRL